MPTGSPPRLRLADFLAVRPTFTRAGLRLVWFAILLWQALTYAAFTGRTLASPHTEASTIAYVLATGAIAPIVMLVLWRLLLEVGAEVLAPATPSAPAAERGAFEILLNFLVFRPAFTDVGLSVVWIG